MEGSVAYDRKRFDTRLFDTSGAHVPPGGLGCFSASYNPKNSEMKVTVKVCSRFVAPDELRGEEPALYELLAEFFRQSPADAGAAPALDGAG